MEQDSTQGAGNGDWTTSEETARGLDAAAASLEDSTATPPIHRSTSVRRGRTRRGSGFSHRPAGVQIMREKSSYGTHTGTLR